MCGDNINEGIHNKIKFEIKKGGATGKCKIVASIDETTSNELEIKIIVWLCDPEDLYTLVYGENWKEYYKEHGKMPDYKIK